MPRKEPIILTKDFLLSANVRLIKALVSLAQEHGLDVLIGDDPTPLAPLEFKLAPRYEPLPILAVPKDTDHLAARRQQWRDNLSRHHYRGHRPR